MGGFRERIGWRTTLAAAVLMRSVGMRREVQ